MLQKSKPRWRGAPHTVAFFSALASSVTLVFSPRSGEVHLAGLAYAGALLVTFGLSALYHRPTWSFPALRVFRRIDHAGVFVLIGGSFSAFWSLLPEAQRSTPYLVGMWTSSIIGAVIFAIWTDMPRALRAFVYVALGLCSLPVVIALPVTVGLARACLVGLGAALYIAGATVYARRWPNPYPATFGYCEVFHTLTVIAAVLQFAIVYEHHWAF